MPSITLEIPSDVARALDRQARALLLSRRTYVRAVLAAVAAQAERALPPRQWEAPVDPNVPRESAMPHL
jgi:predicted transcriptional regulator